MNIIRFSLFSSYGYCKSILQKYINYVDLANFSFDFYEFILFTLDFKYSYPILQRKQSFLSQYSNFN